MEYFFAETTLQLVAFEFHMYGSARNQNQGFGVMSDLCAPVVAGGSVPE